MATFSGRLKRIQYAKISIDIDDWELGLGNEFDNEAAIKDYILETMRDEGFNIGDYTWDTETMDVVSVNERPEW